MKLFFSLVCLLMTSVLFAQSSDIMWEQERPLSWIDFKANPDNSNSMHAMTASGIVFGVSYKQVEKSKVEALFTVYGRFAPSKSWKKEDKATDAILEHEQLHFDLTELGARKLRKQLTEFTFTTDFQKEAEALYKKIYKETIASQDLYDLETDHSQNKEEQQKWEKKVKEELEELEQFASSSSAIKRIVPYKRK